VKPTVDKAHKRTLWIALHDGKWHKGKDINMESRMIRAVCAAEPGEFLSGQQGYKLVRYSTDAEINESIADLRSRVSHLNERAAGLETVLVTRQGQKEMSYG
jgi:hypothetical protein